MIYTTFYISSSLCYRHSFELVYSLHWRNKNKVRYAILQYIINLILLIVFLVSINWKSNEREKNWEPFANRKCSFNRQEDVPLLFLSCFVDILLLSWSQKVNLIQVTTHFMDDFWVACDTYIQESSFWTFESATVKRIKS